MKNPMNRRLLRELKDDFAKYTVVFLFLLMLISLVSGFLVADNSIRRSYDNSFEKYRIEDGHFTTLDALSDETLSELEKENALRLYDIRYATEACEDMDATIRIYKDRTEIDTLCLMKGKLPKAEDEIAIDRVFAKNNDLAIGDEIRLEDGTFSISGLVAFPDYSCLFEDNADMMFDSIHFCVAVVTDEAFDAIRSARVTYCYGWMYDEKPTSESKEKDRSDDFLESLVAHVIPDSYIPLYANKAVNFTGDDMGGDKAMFLLFSYIVIVILAFVFAVTTSNTITAEAGVIGTLRASGYTRGELIRHYMVLPVIVSLVAALIGNIIGYTWLKEYMAGMYFNSYSLTTYETLWNAEAFVDTTVVPIVLMFLINLIVLVRKLRISPLQFLRHELKKKSRKKAFRLNTKIPIMHRVRIRILFQNIPNYLTLICGILLASLVVIFGMMFKPMLVDYADLVEESMISKYQYVLKAPVETGKKDAEKYALATLRTIPDKFMEDDVTVYGIQKDSAYIDAKIPEDQVLLSNGFRNKFGIEKGDRITLRDPYEDKEYTFTVAGEYTYDAAMAIFMDIDAFRDKFDLEDSAFSGYFSNEKLTDIDEDYIAGIITKDDLTKISQQLMVSMGDFMSLFEIFGVIMFLLLMFLLSKQIIEKNAQSISIFKILGYGNGEIAGMYIVATSIVVVLSLLISIPIHDHLLEYLFHNYMYTRMTGYIPYMVKNDIFLKMLAMGLASYAVVAFFQMHKINSVPKSDALKNVE